MTKHPKLGRPRTSALNRAEQLHAAKRAQRLRAAVAAPQFGAALDKLIDETVLDLDAWPKLREIAWSRKGRWILAEDALALYERNWRFVEPERLDKTEGALIEQLKDRYGGGVLNV